MTVARNKQTLGRGKSPDFPRLLGGRLCLHYANTVEGPISDEPVDFLTSYFDLVRWAWHAGALEQAEADALVAAARSRPDDAAAVFARALSFREAISAVFRSIARTDAPPAGALARLRDEYAAALGRAQLTPASPTYEWSWAAGGDDLSKPLWLVVESAVDLLLEGDLARVKQCPGAGDCGWLFYDTSRNATRRWCSMEGCGSRVKMRRQYARRKQHDRAHPRTSGGRTRSRQWTS